MLRILTLVITIFAFAVSGCSSTQNNKPKIDRPNFKLTDVNILQNGNCYDANRAFVSLEEMEFLSQNAISADVNYKKPRVRVVENLMVFTFSRSSAWLPDTEFQLEIFSNSQSLFQQSETFQVGFEKVQLDQQQLIYWAEIVEVGTYRQGLFFRNGNKFISVCFGRGGIFQAH
jgi:hypothetical protein